MWGGREGGSKEREGGGEGSGRGVRKGLGREREGRREGGKSRLRRNIKKCTHRGGSGIRLRAGALGTLAAFPFLPEEAEGSFLAFFLCKWTPKCECILTTNNDTNRQTFGLSSSPAVSASSISARAAATSGSRGMPYNTLVLFTACRSKGLGGGEVREGKR